MKTTFKLTGLSHKKSMTCEPLHNEEIFWPKVGLTQDRFDALWNYMKDGKFEGMTCEIEHEGLFKDGTPIQGTVISVSDY